MESQPDFDLPEELVTVTEPFHFLLDAQPGDQFVMPDGRRFDVGASIN